MSNESKHLKLFRIAVCLFFCATTFCRSVAVAADDAIADYQTARETMVTEHLETAGIDVPKVLAAIRETPREQFVPTDQRRFAYFDMALPIGHGQTISPPYIVAFMTQQLDLKPTDRVLEIGTGSGYQAAVLSPLAKEVYSIEIVKPLGEKAAETLSRLGYENVHTRVGDGFKGWPEHAPFDKIIVTCSPENVPKPLIDQLADGGRLVIPVGERFQQTLTLFRKRNGRLEREALQSTFFVPMTGKAEKNRVRLDEAQLGVVNGSFETVLSSGEPVGWYYLRQAKLERHRADQEGFFLTIKNSTPGRAAQALQAIGVNGLFTQSIRLSLRVSAKQISDAGKNSAAQLFVHFYDDNRSPCGVASIGPWSRTFDWKETETVVSIPARAKLAVVAVGLFGATGELMIDDIVIKEEAEP